MNFNDLMHAPAAISFEGPMAPPPGAAPAPGAALYSVRQIGGASFLGTPLLGAALLYLNLRRTGTPASRAVNVLAIGAVVLAGQIAIGIMFPHVPTALGSMVPVLGTAVMYRLARVSSARIEARVGWRPRASGRGPLAIGLALTAVGITALVLASSSQPGRVDFGHRQEVLYTDGATESDARAVGDLMVRLHAFSTTTDHPSTLEVARRDADFVVSIVFDDDALADAQTAKESRALVPILSHALGDAPVVIELCDVHLHSHVTVR